ncbi:hypothetical protein CDD83_4400 [Cordyceps sp. RAO-2017]|nr:hypothetical protein CDD83_4400 [Cordyceps sp. RAO-2017]
MAPFSLATGDALPPSPPSLRRLPLDTTHPSSRAGRGSRPARKPFRRRLFSLAGDRPDHPPVPAFRTPAPRARPLFAHAHRHPRPRAPLIDSGRPSERADRPRWDKDELAASNGAEHPVRQAEHEPDEAQRSSWPPTRPVIRLMTEPLLTCHSRSNSQRQAVSNGPDSHVCASAPLRYRTYIVHTYIQGQTYKHAVRTRIAQMGRLPREW